MEITKEQLEAKIKKFTEDHQNAMNQINQYSVLARKLEGAIELLQLLLKEIEPEKKPVKK